MSNFGSISYPLHFDELLRATERAGFTMACEPLTGALLRTLAAAKPAGRFLEIGTGTGIGTCWILAGMDTQSSLITVERDGAVSNIAQQMLKDDARVEFLVADAEDYLKNAQPAQFDLIFADTFPGKFYLLNEALALLKPGGLYVIDDLLPQVNWPENHQPNVDRLMQDLQNRDNLQSVVLNWSSGIMLVTKLR